MTDCKSVIRDANCGTASRLIIGGVGTAQNDANCAAVEGQAKSKLGSRGEALLGGASVTELAKSLGTSWELSLEIGSFSLCSSEVLLTRQHLCRHLPHTTLHLVYMSDGPQFARPAFFSDLQSLLYLHPFPPISVPSPFTSPERPSVYRYLLTGAR